MALSVKEIEDGLRAAESSRTVDVISVGMLDMMRDDPSLTFASFEQKFRAMESDIYLLAKPAKLLQPPLRAISIDRKTPAETVLWICLDGLFEAKETLIEFDMTMKENLSALETCGVIMFRPMRL